MTCISYAHISLKMLFLEKFASKLSSLNQIFGMKNIEIVFSCVFVLIRILSKNNSLRLAFSLILRANLSVRSCICSCSLNV